MSNLMPGEDEFRPAFIETLVDPVLWYRSTEEHLREALIGPLVTGLRDIAGRSPRGAVIVRLSVRYANPVDPTQRLTSQEVIGVDE